MILSVVRSKFSERLEFLEQIQTHGYTGEYHYATTDDGYILRIDRITNGPLSRESEEKPVVFLQHGILECSDIFVFWHRNTSLAYLLADAGYDVWLGNSRGTTNSRNHTSISAKSRKFWDFNLEHLGSKDLRAMIDYTLNATNQKNLSYIGHSMGTTMSYILLSEVPQYNEKINIVISLAPIAHWDPYDMRALKPIFAAALLNVKAAYVAPRYNVEVLAAGRAITKFCQLNVGSYVCVMIMKRFLGHPTPPFDDNDAAYVTKYIPAGSSLQVMDHFMQNIKSVKFAKYDYGRKDNQKIYGEIKPPIYDTRKISAPVAIFWSKADILATENNVKRLIANLPNLVSNVLIDQPNFIHTDYFFRANNKQLYIDKVLELIDQYKSQ